MESLPNPSASGNGRKPLERNLLDDLKGVTTEPHDLARVVRDEPDAAESEMGKDLGADAVVTRVHGAEADAGVVGLHAAERLGDVDDHAATGLGDGFEAGGERGAGAERAAAEKVAEHILALHAHERRRFVRLAEGEDEVLTSIGERAVDAQLELAPRRLEGAFGDELDEAFAAVAELDELRDRDHVQAELLLEFDELGQARHRAVLVQDFTDDSARVEAGEGREVDRGFGVAGALEHAAGSGEERENMSGLYKGLGLGLRVGEDRDGLRAVVGGDASGDAFGGVDGHREGGALRFTILRHHLGDAQAAELMLDGRDADETARVADHHVDRLGRGLRSRHHEVAGFCNGRRQCQHCQRSHDVHWLHSSPKMPYESLSVRSSHIQ